jgi:hypothetical protein
MAKALTSCLSFTYRGLSSGHCGKKNPHTNRHGDTMNGMDGAAKQTCWPRIYVIGPNLGWRD